MCTIVRQCTWPFQLTFAFKQAHVGNAPHATPLASVVDGIEVRAVVGGQRHEVLGVPAAESASMTKKKKIASRNLVNLQEHEVPFFKKGTL